jgi:hypothetical protein
MAGKRDISDKDLSYLHDLPSYTVHAIIIIATTGMVRMSVLITHH